MKLYLSIWLLCISAALVAARQSAIDSLVTSLGKTSHDDLINLDINSDEVKIHPLIFDLDTGSIADSSAYLLADESALNEPISSPANQRDSFKRQDEPFLGHGLARQATYSILEPVNDPSEFAQNLNNWTGLLEPISAYLDQFTKINPRQQLQDIKMSGSEYIDQPLALVGHQYVQGGAGEGRQLLGPEGTFENVQVIKSDSEVPSYCDPPNPCPIGYSAKDGCLEQFVNSASFSREYQAKQQCACDNEHSLFNCAAPVTQDGLKLDSLDSSKEHSRLGASIKNADSNNNLNEKDDSLSDNSMNRLNTLARTIQNRFGNLATIKNLIAEHKLEMDDSDSFMKRLVSLDG